MLGLNILQDDPTLNTFSYIGSISFVSGETVQLNMQITQPAKGIRYIPEATATITIEFLTSQSGTTITKTATFPFADDRSIIRVELSAAETADIISQVLNVEINEGTSIKIAQISNAFVKIPQGAGC